MVKGHLSSKSAVSSTQTSALRSTPREDWTEKRKKMRKRQAGCQLRKKSGETGEVAKKKHRRKTLMYFEKGREKKRKTAAGKSVAAERGPGGVGGRSLDQ